MNLYHEEHLSSFRSLAACCALIGCDQAGLRTAVGLQVQSSVRMDQEEEEEEEEEEEDSHSLGLLVRAEKVRYMTYTLMTPGCSRPDVGCTAGAKGEMASSDTTRHRPPLTPRKTLLRKQASGEPDSDSPGGTGTRAEGHDAALSPVCVPSVSELHQQPQLDQQEEEAAGRADAVCVDLKAVCVDLKVVCVDLEAVCVDLKAVCVVFKEELYLLDWRIFLPSRKISSSGMKKAPVQHATSTMNFSSQNLAEGHEYHKRAPVEITGGEMFPKDRAPPPHPLCTAALQPALLLMRTVKRANSRKKHAMPKHTLYTAE
ncbi:hypothetical protein EYF80_050342 [Liparis tanakae]|uniref:Uncharacterized protein n=1 Tax=Liparis tanakae TaxID=230148 RepID=A0A4Z2FFE2_9TELE|nr:hypothetical protein EYF80_050342 [Liparis tanakae]